MVKFAKVFVKNLKHLHRAVRRSENYYEIIWNLNGFLMTPWKDNLFFIKQTHNICLIWISFLSINNDVNMTCLHASSNYPYVFSFSECQGRRKWVWQGWQVPTQLFSDQKQKEIHLLLTLIKLFTGCPSRFRVLPTPLEVIRKVTPDAYSW